MRIAVRGRYWTLATVTPGLDCEALRLVSVDRARPLVVLVPFDRPTVPAASSHARHLRPRAWLHALRRLILGAGIARDLAAVVRADIHVIPFQLSPALAMLRDGVTRILVADDVGLGKTIQAGIVAAQLSLDRDDLRTLVVSPAGLCTQWQRELAGRFALESTRADAAWLRDAAQRFPVDVNPWSLPGLYVASHDFLKRPEVRAALGHLTWDLVIVDEAHRASLGTERRDGVDLVASRSRRVMLLTATPNWTDQAELAALTGIGRVGPDDPPLRCFRRTRVGVGLGQPRHSRASSVLPSADESRMHDLIERYTAQIWREAAARGDDRARLVSVVLRKRALSGAGALLSSVRRRLALLAGRPVEATADQLVLPLRPEPDCRDDEDDATEDGEPLHALAAPGLSDPRRETRWLSTIAEAAALAARRESKIAFLLRLLRRVHEPAIVFTEYRDTLARLRRAVNGPTRHRVELLHGGLPLDERHRAVVRFNELGGLLLATDAAAEGLNLHHHCRLVVHFELPWNPVRLEQRAGRVDRFGQTRRVHEIALVAAHTAERMVLAPLMRRAASARLTGERRGVLDALTESRVAELVMSGQAETPAPATAVGLPADLLPGEPPDDLDAVASSLGWLRHVRACTRSSQPGAAAPVLSVLRRTALDDGLIVVFCIESRLGDVSVASDLLAVRLSLTPQCLTLSRPRYRVLLQTIGDAPPPVLRAILDEHRNACLARASAKLDAERRGPQARASAIDSHLALVRAPVTQPQFFDWRRAGHEAASFNRPVRGPAAVDRIAPLALRVNATLAAALLLIDRRPR